MDSSSHAHNNRNPNAYIDADFFNDTTTRKSVSGMAITLNGAPVQWQAKTTTHRRKIHMRSGIYCGSENSKTRPMDMRNAQRNEVHHTTHIATRRQHCSRLHGTKTRTYQKTQVHKHQVSLTPRSSTQQQHTDHYSPSHSHARRYDDQTTQENNFRQTKTVPPHPNPAPPENSLRNLTTTILASGGL